MSIDITTGAKKEKRFFGCNANMWLYALGIMGINLGIGLVNSYQAEFFNKILNVDLMIIAIIILAAKFISIFADIIVGNLIDRANFKAGKMKPWILISAFPLAILTMLSYVNMPFTTDAGRYVYIVFIVVLWNVSMTMADVPSQGMLSFLSKDPADTNNAAGIANMLKQLALGCPGIMVTVVCMLTKSEKVGEKEYLILAGLLAGVGLILQLIMYFFCKEEVRLKTSNSSLTFKEMFNELKHNKMIMIVLITFLLGFGRNIAFSIAVQASCIMFREGIHLTIGNFVFDATGDKCSWLLASTSFVTNAIVTILNPILNKKLGEKKYFIIMGFFGFAVSIFGYLMFVLGTGVMRSWWMILIYHAFLGAAVSPNSYIPMVMTADIVDYQEWKTGKRTEGTQFAILSMSNKLSNALNVSLGILFIGAIGYSSAKYSATYEAVGASGISSYITDDMQNKCWAIYELMPGLCMLASSLVMFFYKIDEPTKKLMREELKKRHEAESNVGVTDISTADISA